MSLKQRLRGIFNRGRMGDSAPSTMDIVLPKPVVEQARQREGWKQSPAKQAAEWTEDIAWHNNLLRQMEKAARFRMWCNLDMPAPYFLNRRTHGGQVERNGVWQALAVPTLKRYELDPGSGPPPFKTILWVDCYMAWMMAKGDHVDALWWKGVRTVEASRSQPIRPKHERLSKQEHAEAREAAELRAKLDMIERSRVIESAADGAHKHGADAD